MQRTSNRRIAIAILAFAFPIAALADLSRTTTLQANQTLNLETGATDSSGGDLLWNGTTLIPQGAAKAANIGVVGDGSGNNFSKIYFDAFKSVAKSTAIPANKLVVRDEIAVFTNGGYTAGVLVTANSGGSITLQFTTYQVTPPGPNITGVLNNSSEIPDGFPSSGIAPSSLFKILGTGLAAPGDATLHSSEGAGLQLSLNGANITVTAGGTTVHPAIYYATPTQIDAVMPAATPPGVGTVTVTYNGVDSQAFSIQVMAAAPGITTYNGSGVAQHAATAALITYTDSAAPGETIILWGTGLGSDPADSDTTYTSTPHQVSLSYAIYIGGIQVTPVYAGASVYPGVDVFGVTIPQNVPTGCWVSVAAVTGIVVSNVVTLPINPGGGACVDSQTGLSGNQITSSGGQTIRGGLVALLRTSNSTGVTNSADGGFAKYTGVYTPPYSISPGACIVTYPTPSNVGVQLLDPGMIQLTGPGGLSVPLAPTLGGYYANLDSSPIPLTGGTYTFTGSGGRDVGSFTSTLTLTNPLLTWTNQAEAASIDRTQGLHVTWTGGNPGSSVLITGSAFNAKRAAVTFYCSVLADAHEFTVPSYILMALPPGNGSTLVQNSVYAPLTATGLDAGTAMAAISFTVSSTYR